MEVSMKLDLSKFMRDMDRTEEQLEQDYTRMLRVFTLNIFKQILMRSPVDTGAFRASWSIGVNKKPDAVAKVAKGQKLSPSAASSKAMRKGSMAINLINLRDDVWVSNHLPYAEPLEKGHSKQAPDGVVRPVLDSWENALRRAHALAVRTT